MLIVLTRYRITQEFGVSQGGMFIYGNQEIPRNILYEFVVVFGTFGSSICREHAMEAQVQQAFSMLTAYNSLKMWFREIIKDDREKLQIRSRVSLKTKELSFLHLLNKTRDGGSQATLSSDHLYAFLGHPCITSGKDPQITVDYTSPIANVFLNFAETWLWHSDDLQILSSVYHEDDYDLHSGASWVPKWDRPNPYLQIGGLLGTFVYGAGRQSRYRKLSRSTIVNHGHLDVGGHVIGKISSAPIEFDETSFGTTDVPQFWTTCRKVAAAINQHANRPILEDSAVLSLLTGGNRVDWPSGSTPMIFGAGAPRPSSIIPDSTFFAEHVMLKRIMEPCRTSASRFSRGRRLFITATGEVGLGPRITKTEDICCILHGGHVPIILRETSEGTFRLVGEAYVEGIMYEAKPDGKQHRRFIII
jgi:hypothetical protein